MHLDRTLASLRAGLLYAGSLWLANSSYLYLSVSFIQMTKSLMPGLVFISGVMLGTEKYNLGTALNMTMIAFGVVVCAIGEESLVFKGLMQQLTALMFEVRHWLPCFHSPVAWQQHAARSPAMNMRAMRHAHVPSHMPGSACRLP